jgi:hypothetical protein
LVYFDGLVRSECCRDLVVRLSSLAQWEFHTQHLDYENTHYKHKMPVLASLLQAKNGQLAWPVRDRYLQYDNFDTASSFLVVWLKKGSGLLASVQALRACTFYRHCDAQRSTASAATNPSNFEGLRASICYQHSAYTARSATQRSAHRYTAPCVIHTAQRKVEVWAGHLLPSANSGVLLSSPL